MDPLLPLAAAETTRPVFWDFTTWLEVLWYALAGVSVAVFAAGLVRPLLRYRRAAWSRPCPDLARRLLRTAWTVAVHRTIGLRNRYALLAHAAVFYGFLTLLAGTIVLLIAHDLAKPLGWDFFRGDFYLGYSLVLDVLGLAFTIGLALFVVRRGLVKPRALDYRRPDRDGAAPGRGLYRLGDWVFLMTLLVLAVTGFVQEGIRIAMDAPGHDWANPVGWLCSLPLAGLSEGTLGALRHGVWWFHGLVAITWVAAIPYTKATHMLQGFVALALSDERAMRRLPPIPPERADQPAGYRTLDDFERKHLVDLDACTKCGRCHDVCPANASGMPLSPRDVVLELREQAIDRDAPLAARGELHGMQLVGEDGVREATLWSCMQCNACVEVCPVGIEQAPIIAQLRRGLVEDGELEPALQGTLQTIHSSGNSFGESRRKRGRWTRELDFEVPDARRSAVDVLWFVGDYASFDPRSQRVTQTVARLLHAAGVDFGILYDGERNAGNDVRRVGEEGLFELLAQENAATLAGCDFQRIVTSDPHSLNTLRNEYPDVGASYEVVHHTALLAELVRSGRLGAAQPLGKRVTYHDPCYLGRVNGGFDAPRELLAAIGCELVEMPRNRASSFCCGAGGGRIWMREDYGMTERPSEQRIREALSLGDLDYFVVSCPKDVTMYEDAIKTTGSGDRIELREIAELVALAHADALEPKAAA